MPSLAAISKIDFPFRIEQEKVKKCAQELFEPSFPQVQKMMSVFDNTEIKTRNFEFCKLWLKNINEELYKALEY